jgi:simple sugar transport system substrate-binding protein/ribose transport system substrate-binding protein
MTYRTFVRGGLVATAAASCLLLAACSSSSKSGGSTGGSSGSGKIGYSESFLTDPFQVQLVKQLATEATSQGADLLPAVNANNDPAKQNADVQTLIGRGVKGLIIVPVDGKAISPVIAQANSKKIPVVTVDEAPDQGTVTMIVRADNVAMGKDACEYVGKQLNNTGSVLNLQGDLSSVNGLDRNKGFVNCMSSQFPGIQVISKPMNWKSDQCATQAQTVLSTTKINALFMASESVCLSSVQNVMRNQGKLTKTGTSGHIISAAIDGTPAALAAIRAGTLDAVVSQPLNLYGKYAISYIKGAMAGQTFQPGDDGHGGQIVKSGSASLQDLLPSPTVTKANVDDKTLWGNG